MKGRLTFLTEDTLVLVGVTTGTRSTINGRGGLDCFAQPLFFDLDTRCDSIRRSPCGIMQEELTQGLDDP